MLGLTYVKKNEEITKALDNTLEALKSVEEIDLRKLPLEVLEKLIMVLVNYGQECQIKLK